MKVFVGLGNPGTKYYGTRHNVGFDVLDALAEAEGVSFNNSPKTKAEMAKIGSDVLLCKPTTFMNDSGAAVRAIFDYYKIPLTENLDSLYVVHDDLDIELGSYKFQLGRGPKSHNGLLSIYDHLHTNNFWHVRAGVDNRGELRNKIVPSEYVLQTFAAEELSVIQNEVTSLVKELQSKL